MMFLIIIAIFILSGCQCLPTAPVVENPPPATQVEPEAPVVVQPPARIALYWENTDSKHDERKPWSDALNAEIKKDLSAYAASTDMVTICPKFYSLNQDDKIKAIGEFWVATAYYESGFNPKSYSVDVGNANNKETWSVGLYQMSGTDGAAKVYGANFNTLQDPIVNIKVATEQMHRQLKNTNTILLPNSSKYRYWAVLLHGNKYTKIPEIKARVLKYAPKCK